MLSRCCRGNSSISLIPPILQNFINHALTGVLLAVSLSPLPGDDEAVSIA